MATNQEFADGRKLSVAVTAPATPASGDPVLFGQRPGVALTDEDANGDTSVDFGGVYNLTVDGQDDLGAAAIAAGDILYYDGGQINADAVNGVRFGYAMDPVGSGQTLTIRVIIGY